ncbi:MAG: outer membrane protein assembly factor BamA [Planctomycetes bacterium]|nr:outer membrane protein assembly factor BamA [Planctomycetota bacterium]
MSASWRPLATLLLGMLLLLGAPLQAQEEDDNWSSGDWSWAEDRQVQGVFFEGLQRLNPREMSDLIGTRPGQPFSARRLSLDVARLYRSGRFGSPRPGVPPVAVAVRAEGAGVVVEFTVHERLRVGQVVFRGGRGVLKEEDIDSKVTTRAGGLFDVFTITRDQRALEALLRERGHVSAKVTVEHVEKEIGVLVRFTIRPGPAVYVEKVIYVGAKQLDPGVLADATGPDAMETKEREFFGFLEEGLYQPEALERDLDRIARYYRSQGFLDVRVYKLAEEYSIDGKAVTLRVGVDEGARYTVRRVAIEGTQVIDGDRILTTIPIRPGRPFLGEDLRIAIERIKHMYGQRAYVHAQVGPQIHYDLERHMLDLTLNVEEGPKVRIEQIKIEGNEKTLEKVIRRELSFHPGEYFNADEVQASIGRLGRLRFFQDVRIDFEPGSEPGSEHVIVRVVEARTGSFVLGGGVSTNTGFFGNISLTQRNFDILDPPTSLKDFVDGRALTGAGQSLTLQLQPGRQRSQFSLQFIEPYLFDFPIPMSIEGAIRDRQREDWLESRRTLRFGLGYRITQDLVFRATYRFERIRIADVEPDAVPDAIRVAGTNFIAGIRFTLTYDQNLIDQDFVLYGGYSATAYYEYVTKALGSDFEFHQAGLTFNAQWPLFSWPSHHKWVIQIRGETGWQRELLKNDIPLFERFYAGGQASLRGFRFRSVSPKQRNDPVGGRFLSRVTAELTYPIFKDILRGVVFTDMGTVTATHRDYSQDELRISAGFGFRIKVPFFPAPVALDFGWPVKKKKIDERQVFSFAVGFGF